MSVEQMSLSELLVEPQSTDDLQIPQNLLIDIILRLLHNEGNVNFRRIVQVTKTPSPITKIMDWMRQEHLVEMSQTNTSQGPFHYVYKLTDAGQDRAREALDRSLYVGPIPVPVHYYNRAIELQTQGSRKVTAHEVQNALNELVLEPDFHRRIGPAINSAASLFLYGPSGNGKTTIAQQVATLIAGTRPIWLPYALTAGGQIIQIHDRLVHNPLPANAKERQEMGNVDGRWDLFARPSIVVGGELKMDALDLRFDPILKFYEAPLQLKANGGMFLIDDFGRQQIHPVDLLNRWIIPLEDGVDYLRLRTGQTIVVPFRELIVFCTNLEPYKLADDAFYRRIQIKVAVTSPDEERYRQVFFQACAQLGIRFQNEAYEHLVEKWYHEPGRIMQAVHPRDLLTIIIALCEYEGQLPQMTPKLLDEACAVYFVGE